MTHGESVGVNEMEKKIVFYVAQGSNSWTFPEKRTTQYNTVSHRSGDVLSSNHKKLVILYLVTCTINHLLKSSNKRD